MRDKYFLQFGSPGKFQILGPLRCDHHSGWIEVDSWTWGPSPANTIAVGAGVGRGGSAARAAAVREVAFWRKADSVSALLGSYGMAAAWFDRIAIEIWDDAAQRLKSRIDFGGASITSYQAIGGGDSFTIAFDDMKMAGAWSKTAAIAPAALQVPCAKAARRPPTAARG